MPKNKFKFIKYYIARKTKNFRYKFTFFIMKYLTPVLCKKIDANAFIKKRVFQPNIDNCISNIRPSIQFIKEKFNKNLLIGAEIGVQRGTNSESILKELDIQKLYLVDVWVEYGDYIIDWTNYNYNLVQAKFRNDKRVEIIKEFSEIAVNDIKDNSLDFVYIDANHKYEYVSQDIELWFPKVKIGGVVAGHDVCIPDVLKAIKDFCSGKNIKFKTEIPDWYFVK